MSEQLSQQSQGVLAETSLANEAPKWGALPPAKRIAALETRLAAWERLSPAERGDPTHGEGRSAFDRQGPQAWEGDLAIADVCYLAARALAGSTKSIAMSWAAERLATETGVDLSSLHLEGVSLRGAHLEGVTLAGARLDGASLVGAHLEGADLSRVHLGGADLRGVTCDRRTRLNDAILTVASFDQASFDNTNLTVVDWSRVDILGDERTARERKGADGRRKARQQRIEGYKAAVRAYRVLAVSLQAQGLNEDAARFAYRGQVMQRRVLFHQRKPGAYFFSVLLAVLAGYGYRLWRILATYLIALAAYAAVYWLLGVHSFAGEPWWQALWDSFLVSLSAIHGRATFEQLGAWSPAAWVAASESVVGIVIEGVFVAMLIQRFFAR